MSQLPDSVRQRIERGDAEVQELCERLGYGFVMDSAARQWKQKDPIGAFTIGPCVAIAKAESERAMKLVEAAKNVARPALSRGKLAGTGDWSFTISGDDWDKLTEAISAYMKSEG